MTRFMTNRDGGETDEKGHLRFMHSTTVGEVFSGGVVSQNSTPNMSVNVAIIDALIRDAANKYVYHIWSDAVENVAIATADAANPRRDFVIAYADRAVTPTGVNNPSVWKLISVAGTPAGSPADPTVAQIQASAVGSNPYIILARVDVAAATTSITDGSINDLRSFVKLAIDLRGVSVTDSMVALAAIRAKHLQLPHGRIYYSTAGTTGGQVATVGTNDPLVFDTLDSDSVGVTKPANGILQVSEGGNYNISTHIRCADAPQNGQLIKILASTDAGVTWFELIAWNPPINMSSVNRGLSVSTTAYLPANARLKTLYHNGGAGNTRLAATDATDQKYTCSLAVGM